MGEARGAVFTPELRVQRARRLVRLGSCGREHPAGAVLAGTSGVVLTDGRMPLGLDFARKRLAAVLARRRLAPKLLALGARHRPLVSIASVPPPSVHALERVHQCGVE
eukprot:1705217-Prymnesium_polylepis.1